MNPIRSSVLLFLVCGIWLSAADTGTLPEIVARFGDMVVTREQAGELLSASSGKTAELPFREALKKCLTEYFCCQALRQMLIRQGFPPSAEEAEKALFQVYANYPEGISRPSDGDIRRMAREPMVQLQWALRGYMEKERPDLQFVPAEVVERYYRERQSEFMRPRRKLAVLCLADSLEALEFLQIRVKQGQSPLRAGESVKGVRITAVDPSDDALKTLRAGQWGPAYRRSSGYGALYVIRELPADYVPLEDAAPLIREILGRRRAARELENTLNTILSNDKVEFYF